MVYEQLLKEKCRKIPGTPILYLHHSAPVLEKPSELSENQAKNCVEERMNLDQKKIENMKKQMGIQVESKNKKKKKKNPNPLSCLKSKKKKVEPLKTLSENSGKIKKKRVRNRKKNKTQTE